MQKDFRDNTQGDRLAFSTDRDFKCSKCGNMYPMAQSTCDVCGNRCTESTCDIVNASSEDF